MPNLTLYDNPLDPNSRKEVPFEPGRRLSEIIEAPSTFWVNGEIVSDAILSESDVIVVAASPRVEAIMAVIAAVNWYAVAASVAINLIANALMGKPDAPTTSTLADASSVYSLGPGQNSARLGAVIPVIYGRVVVTPDYAAQPTLEFVDNQQWLYALFCLGVGHVEVHDVLIGDSSYKHLSEAQAFSFEVYTPDKHKENFGLIEAETGVYENMVTASEVENQELNAPNSKATSEKTWYWKRVAEGNTSAGGYGVAEIASADALKAQNTSPLGAQYQLDEGFWDYPAPGLDPA